MACGTFIVQGKRPERPEHPAFTDELWSLMKCCWKVTPNLRPTSSEVLGALEVLTCRRLAGHHLTRPQHISLINAVFSDHNWSKVINHVEDDCTQDFLNVVDEVNRQRVIRLADRLADCDSDFCLFSIRRWRTWHQRFGGDVFLPYIGYAAAKL